MSTNHEIPQCQI